MTRAANLPEIDCVAELREATMLYRVIRKALVQQGYEDDIRWAQTVKPPASADDLAREAIWVILNSGMKNQVAEGIAKKLWPVLDAGGSAHDVFGHKGKSDAIDHIWANRKKLLAEFRELSEAEEIVEWCERLPWVGPITKWHLAKNLGVDCAKPDRHLQRLADLAGTDPALLCETLAKTSGDRVATVDYVIWRACNLGAFDHCKEMAEHVGRAVSQ